MSHARAAVHAIEATLRKGAITRHGQPIQLRKHGRGLYSLEAGGQVPFGAPSRAPLKDVVDWVLEALS